MCAWRGRGHSLFQGRERVVHGNIRGFSSVRRRWRHRQWCLNGRRKISRAVFLKAAIVSVFERRSALHDQRRAVATAFRLSTLVIFLERDQQKIDDGNRQELLHGDGDCILRHHAVVHVESFEVGRGSKVASTFPATATTAFPFATFAHSCTTCVVETQHLRLGKSRPAPKPLMAECDRTR